MVKEVVLVELVGETGVDEDRKETNEAQSDVYREPGPDPTDCFDESDPSAPLDNRVELGRDEEERTSVS